MENYKKLLKSNDFKEAMRSKKLCLFIGAGVGCNIKMPNWQNLAYKITNFCLKHKVINNSCKYHLNNNCFHPEKIISYCIGEIEKKGKIKEFGKEVLEELFINIPKNNFENNNIYKDLIKIYKSGRALFVQTNYDSIVEDNSSSVLPFVPYLDSEKQNPNNRMVVYLHGKYDNRKNNYNELVLTRSMYNSVYVIENQGGKNEYYKKQRRFIEKLLEQYFIIFLGYSLEDREIVQLIANRRTARTDKKICVISDLCKANKIDVEIQAQYLNEATNKNTECYFYNTEKTGFKAFEKVISDLRKAVASYIKPIDLMYHADGRGIIFEDD